MKSPRANVALRLAMAALTFMATMQWHPASVLAGEYIGNDPVVAAHAERASVPSNDGNTTATPLPTSSTSKREAKPPLR